MVRFGRTREKIVSNKATEDQSEGVGDRRRLFYVNQRLLEVKGELERLREERDELKERLRDELEREGG